MDLLRVEKKPMWTSEVFGNDAFMTIWPHNGKCSLKIRYQSIFSKIFKRSHFVQNFATVAENKFFNFYAIVGQFNETNYECGIPIKMSSY